MGGGIWGLGFSIVDQRRKKLLKRLVATPMSRAEYLASYVISRLVLLTIEAGVLVGLSILLFGVPMRGSWFAIASIIVVAALAFGGLGLLIASRSKTIEGVSGLMNLTMLPMWVLSGVFFSSENFPGALQPFIKALPLTATNDALACDHAAWRRPVRALAAARRSFSRGWSCASRSRSRSSGGGSVTGSAESPVNGLHGDLPRHELMSQGRAVLDWIADYLDNPERYPVLSSVRPGDIRASLPVVAADAKPSRSRRFSPISNRRSFRESRTGIIRRSSATSRRRRRCRAFSPSCWPPRST